MNGPDEIAGVVVAGFGSPHGDDQVGWRVATLIEASCGSAARVILVQDWTQLLTALHDCSMLIVVDGCSSGQSPGEISCCKWPHARLIERRGKSTHAAGVTYVLRLAEALGRLPQSVIVYGIEVGECAPDGAMTAEVEMAAGQLAHVIAAQLREAAYA